MKAQLPEYDDAVNSLRKMERDMLRASGVAVPRGRRARAVDETDDDDEYSSGDDEEEEEEEED